MIIYLDTNIIEHENFLKSLVADSFLKSCAFLDIAIFIPEAVIDEAICRYKRKIQNLSKEIYKLNNNYDRLIGRKFDVFDVDTELAQFEKIFREKLDKYSVKILPYPEIQPQMLLINSYSSKKPFKDNGAGFKDFIIWKTIVENISINGQDFKYYLLSNNPTDFAESTANSEIIHSDLSSDLPENTEILIKQSLRRFFDECISPLLENVDVDEIPNINKNDIILNVERLLHSNLYEYEAFRFLDHYSNDLTIVDTGDVYPSNITIQKIDEDNLLIKVKGEVEVDMHGFIDKFDYYANYEELQHVLYMIDDDYNDHVFFVSEIGELPFEVAFIYSESSGKHKTEFVQLTSEIGKDEFMV